MDIKSKIHDLIINELNVSKIDLVDESYKHIGHNKDTSGGHFKLMIVSDDFQDMKLLDRHKLIYNILGRMIKVDIHALSIRALTKQEDTK